MLNVPLTNIKCLFSPIMKIRHSIIIISFKPVCQWLNSAISSLQSEDASRCYALGDGHLWEDYDIQHEP